MPAPPLKCFSMICCERIYRIAETPDNMMSCNAFHTLIVSKIPAQVSMTVLYTVIEGHGSYDMCLSLVNAASGQVVREWRDRHTVKDPLAVGDVQLILHGVPLEKAGKYLLELKCKGELIGSRPFYARVVKRCAAQTEE